MPPWKGWNEDQVREQKSIPQVARPNPDGKAPEMAGFTAINAPRPQTQIVDQFNAPHSTRAESRANNDATRNQGTVASDYLGRGNPDATAAEVKNASGPLRGYGTKKTSGTGKKRASAASSQPKGKRRKISDVSSGMQVTKPATKAKKKFTDLPLSSNMLDSLNSTTPRASSTSYTTAHEHTVESQPTAQPADQKACVEAAAPAVSVLAPATSMNSLRSSSPMTSFDAIRSSGKSTTVYQGRSNQSDKSLDAQYHRVSLLQAKHSDPQANSRVLRPRTPNASPINPPASVKKPELADGAQFTAVPRVSDSNSNRSSIKQPAKSGMNAKTGHTALSKSTATSRTLSEDFLTDDDGIDLIEALTCAADAVEIEHEVASNKYTVSAKAAQQRDSIGLNKASHRSPTNKRRVHRDTTPVLGPDEEFTLLCDEDEVDIVDLTDNVEENAIDRSPTPQHRDKKLNLRDVDPNEDYGGALLSETDRQILASMKSSQTTDNPVIIRKPFPSPILDRSPIFGVTNTSMLRTCFRLGEALNVGSNAVRTNTNIILELYARVWSSYREGRKQHFVFRDLYHDNPPHLEGIFELWQQSQLWELDSRAFLGRRGSDNVAMCRLMGRMKKDAEPGGTGKVKYRLEVLSIWEADWEDIDYVAGIYAKD